MNKNSNETIELKKYDWEGNLIWSRPVPWRWINTTADNLAINNSGSIFFSMRDIAQERSVLVKVLADGSNSYTANADPTAVPIVPSVSAYPNPFRDQLNISSKGQKNLEIYNLKGQLIRSWRKQDSAIWDGRDTAGKACPAGIYILKGDSRSRKIIKLN